MGSGDEIIINLSGNEAITTIRHKLRMYFSKTAMTFGAIITEKPNLENGELNGRKIESTNRRH